MAEFLSSPASVEIEINQECNFSCSHCYLANAPEQRLSLADFERVILELRRNDVFSLAITGGEPLIHPDIYEMVRSARDNSYSPLVATNGSMLSRDVAERLKESGIGAVQISLDNPDRAAHDEFRRSQGAYDSALEAARICVNLGIPASIISVLTSLNARSAAQVTKIAASVGVMDHRLIPYIPWASPWDPDGAGKRLMPTAEQVVPALRELTNTGRMLGVKLSSCHPGFNYIFNNGELFECPAGTTNCAITAKMTVKPCSAFPREAGTLIGSSLKEVWDSSPVFKELRRASCGGCRAIGFSRSGTLGGSDPIYEALVAIDS